MTKAAPSQVERSISMYIEVMIISVTKPTTTTVSQSIKHAVRQAGRRAGELITHSESTPQQNLSLLSSVGSREGLEELSS